MAGADHGAATTRSRSLKPLSVAGSRVPTSRTKRSARPSRGERKCLFSRLLINPEKPDLSEKSAPPALKSIWQSRRHIVCETTVRTASSCARITPQSPRGRFSVGNNAASDTDFGAEKVMSKPGRCSCCPSRRRPSRTSVPIAWPLSSFSNFPAETCLPGSSPRARAPRPCHALPFRHPGSWRPGSRSRPRPDAQAAPAGPRPPCGY